VSEPLGWLRIGNPDLGSNGIKARLITAVRAKTTGRKRV
jgi:hypothetical protein